MIIMPPDSELAVLLGGLNAERASAGLQWITFEEFRESVAEQLRYVEILNAHEGGTHH